MLRNFFRKLLVRHDWLYPDTGDCRKCATCGRVEELVDPGGGMEGPIWDVMEEGDMAAHSPQATASTTSAPQVEPLGDPVTRS